MTKQVTSNNLLASIAVFAELCDTQKDIQGIVIEFIKSVFALEKIWSLDSNEATILLKKHFDFDIPEAVVRTCLNSLTKNGFVEKRLGKYNVIDKSFNAQSISDKLNNKKIIQDTIENELVVYCEKLQKRALPLVEKEELITGFIGYLMDNGVADKFATIISSFVLEKSNNEKFIKDLNQIKEGLVMLTGLRYTNDLNALGFWKDELTIYLDTEHLFNAEGYNGEVFQRLFNDFFDMVKEINALSKKRTQKKIIHLRYFEETKEEIERFFYVAEKIVKREDNHSPENIAMEAICKGCVTVTDVLLKKASFERNLAVMGISMQEELDYYSKLEFNIEDPLLLSKYNNKYPEDELANLLRSFTKINFLRKGNNRTRFEKCGHIILTGKTISLILSRDLQVKNELKDIPFATDIYFITNRIWYRLNKGLSKSNKLPATLDIVTKAQTVLSSQINKSVEKQYETLKSDLKSGKIDSDSAQNYYYGLREKARKPEDIKKENINESVEFIFEDDLETYLREKSNLENRAKEGDAAKNELRKIKSKISRQKKRFKKLKARLIYFTVTALLFSLWFIVPFFVFLIIEKIKEDHDTTLTVLGVFIAIVLAWGSLFKYLKKSQKAIRKRVCRLYLQSIKK